MNQPQTKFVPMLIKFGEKVKNRDQTLHSASLTARLPDHHKVFNNCSFQIFTFNLNSQCALGLCFKKSIIFQPHVPKNSQGDLLSPHAIRDAIPHLWPPRRGKISDLSVLCRKEDWRKGQSTTDRHMLHNRVTDSVHFWPTASPCGVT